MNPRTTAILALVTLIAGTALYLREFRGADERAAAEEAGKRLFQELAADDVSAIELMTSDGESARLERREGDWRLISPVDVPADAVNANQLATNLVNIASEKVLEGAVAPEVYGLTERARAVRFETSDGGGGTLRLGDDAPVGSETYARAGEDGAIVTVQTFRANAFDKALLDLRERRVAIFDRASVRGLEVQWPGDRVVLERNGGADDDGERWQMRTPVEARADAEAVDALLSALSFLRAEAFVDDPAPGDGAGLDPPALAISLRIQAEGEAERTLRLAIGPEEGDRRRVRGAENYLYEVGASELPIETSVTAYRYRKLGDFTLADAVAFELELEAQEGASRIALRGERAEADASGWVVSPTEMQDDLATALVSEASSLEASRIAAESLGEDERRALGLVPPRTASARLRRIGGRRWGGRRAAAARRSPPRPHRPRARHPRQCAAT